MRRIFAEHLSEQMQVVFGVYDLSNRLVGLPDLQEDWRQGLFVPPPATSVVDFAEDVVRSVYVRTLLGRA